MGVSLADTERSPGGLARETRVYQCAEEMAEASTAGMEKARKEKRRGQKSNHRPENLGLCGPLEGH